MIITFDTVAKAMYVKLAKGKVAKTVEFAPETFVDLDKNGKLMGVEMLNPGKLALKKKVRPHILPRLANKFHVPELKSIPKEVNQYLNM